MTNVTLREESDVENPHFRFDEGEVAPAATSRRGSLPYKEGIEELKSLSDKELSYLHGLVNDVPGLLIHGDCLFAQFDKMMKFGHLLVHRDSSGLIDGVVGFYSNDKIDLLAKIMYIAVDERSRRRGIGGMLLDAVRGQSQIDGMRQVSLQVLAGNEKARRLYLSHGYREHPEVSDGDRLEMRCSV